MLQCQPECNDKENSQPVPGMGGSRSSLAAALAGLAVALAGTSEGTFDSLEPEYSRAATRAVGWWAGNVQILLSEVSILPWRCQAPHHPPGVA